MSDTRFARLQTDPRFRRAKQKNVKVEIDDRFKDVLQSEEFGGSGKGKGKGGKVDKRGRKLGASHGADQLKHFYRLRSPDAGEEGAAGGEKGFVDYARGEGVLDSSGSEDEESEVEEDELEIGPRKAPAVPKYLQGDSDDDESGSGSDGEDHLDIDLSEDEGENAEPASVFPDEDGEEVEEEEQYAEPTKRIAAVNLDWDNLQAGDLYTIFNSFLKPTGKNGESSTSVGKLLSVKIYPSEFGKKRLEMEEREGPGGGVFVSKKGDRGKAKAKKREGIEIHRDGEDEDEEEDEEEAIGEYEEIDEDEYENEVYEPSDDEDGSGGELEDGASDDDDEHDDDEEDFDSEDDAPPRTKSTELDGLEIVSDVASDAGSDDIDMDQLRQYQLERLRYWYAIATFSTVQAAMKVLAECNGAEFEMTANMFDLSYVPDEMEFDDSDIKEEATKEPKAYKGNDFVTDALRHSKVKLTWDQDDPNRSKLTRRNLTKDQIDEEDFKAYLASSGSESEGEAGSDAEASTAKGKKAKGGKKASKSEREKLRALLLNGDDEDGDVWGKAGLSNGDTGKADKNGDMEITFRPGLSAGGLLAKDDENLTTLEKYQMRMKEKKARKKEKGELRRAAKDVDASDEEGAKATKKKVEQDDFFGDSDSEAGGVDVPTTLPDDERDVEEEDKDLHQDLGGGKGVEHFSMKDVLKAEKEGGKKKRSRHKKKVDKRADEREVQLGKEGWKIDVKDERFKALHEEPEFAIDPSNPHFVKTKAMKDLLDERNKRRKDTGDRPPVEKGVKRSATEEGQQAGEKDLSDLVQSVKRKVGDGAKKPRKRSRK